MGFYSLQKSLPVAVLCQRPQPIHIPRHDFHTTILHPRDCGCTCIHNVYTVIMSTKTTINVRTELAIKREAQRVFKRMGLDLSTGVNMYLSRVAQDKAMPFVPRTVNGFTPEYEAQMIRETEYAEKYGKRYTADQVMKEFFS